MSDLDDIVREFLVESHEGLDQLDRNLVALEQRPGDRELLASIFRCIHTIKGTCGFLGFGKLESVSHVGENLLSRLRDGKLALTPEITSALLRLVDAVRAILAHIEADKSEGEAEYGELIAVLTELQTEKTERTAKTAKGDRAEGEIVEESDTSSPSSPSSPSLPSLPSSPSSQSRSSSAESNIRVDVGLLDKLMNLVGELVLARNQILQFTAGSDSTFQATSQRLNLITTELQEGVMKTRMQPIGNVWSKFPRIVRDLAVACGKQVRVEMEGRETELDKTIIEAIKDPLTHIIRNSVDHGIESPEVRVAAGKPAEGRLFLRAYHEGGKVNIEIIDDGGGINVERVKQKALDRGLIAPDQASRMTDRDAVQLVFLPGFSTAERVTNVSGRGVGMDVVRTNIEKIGGVVDIQSVPGAGTTLRVKIPLTLAIIPALMVTTRGDRFAIPQVSLLELVRLDEESRGSRIEHVYGAPVYRLRGALLPLVRLSEQLGTGGEGDGGVTNIVVLQADDQSFGLIVDEINDTEEIVVKPLGKQLKSIPAYAGATIMGDGRIALILDVLGLAQQAGVIAQGRERPRTESLAKAERSGAERQTLLLFGLGADRRLAIPLSRVSRLEELSPAIVERAGGREVVQYRGEIMPLARLSDLLGVAPGPLADPLQVVVSSGGGRRVGLVVDRIVDIVEETVRLQPAEGGHLLGSAVIQDRVTDLLDVEQLLGS